ncbi:tellurite resistance protein [Lebetimonas natsushimae]|uniref:Tellurite resistance protein n=1 Tax=Lebetimonas natsushimae TaxID=1936991 RepID=A0A292YDB2_9BACT|nr:SLAC1 anion channel family protein [Lebetimonas natsushimae]GAX87416.1 tellurite resistance protein [Lebetimonas natsushimae]
MRSLQYFPVQLFAVIMGLSGLAIAYAKAYHFLNFPYWPYFTLLILDTIAFFGIFITYVIKWVKYPDAINAEVNHPVKSSFIAAISISFLLISIAYMDFAPPISVTFWWIGAWLHLFFTFNVIKFWIRHQFDVKMINPAWFIPIVGNVLVPIAGVDIVNEYVNLFFFSIGIFYWIVLFTIVTYRMIFHHPLPKKLIPTFFILIAPPAVGFISYFRISFGSIDTFSMILYLIALFTFFLLLLKKSLYTELPFFISWWAYTFPLAAITISTILIYSSFRNYSMYWFSVILLALVTVVVFYVAYKTYLAVKAQKICIPEEE